MSNYSKNGRKKELKIQRIETTIDRLTGKDRSLSENSKGEWRG